MSGIDAISAPVGPGSTGLPAEVVLTVLPQTSAASPASPVIGVVSTELPQTSAVAAAPPPPAAEVVRATYVVDPPAPTPTPTHIFPPKNWEDIKDVISPLFALSPLEFSISNPYQSSKGVVTSDQYADAKFAEALERVKSGTIRAQFILTRLQGAF